MEVPINDFDDIRPLNNDEGKDAIESLIANEDFERAFRYIKPDVDWKQFCETMRSFKTKEDFKNKLAYEAVMMVAGKTTFSLTISGRSRLPKDKKPCTLDRNAGPSEQQLHREAQCPGTPDAGSEQSPFRLYPPYDHGDERVHLDRAA